MDRPHDLLSSLLADGWRYPIGAGLVSASYTMLQYWLSSSNSLRLEPVFVAGILGGVLFHNQAPKSGRIGFRTGLVSSLALLWPGLDLLLFVPHLSQPNWVGVLQVFLILGMVGLMVLFSVVVGTAGALLGDWVTEKTERVLPSTVRN